MLTNYLQMDESCYELKPQTLDRGPMPESSLLEEHQHVLPLAVVPVVIHSLLYWYFPNFNWHIGVAYALYFTCFALTLPAIIRTLNASALRLGCLDEKNSGRDRAPDRSITNLAIVYTVFPFVRCALAFMHYDASVSPLAQFTWTYPIRIVLFHIVLDCFFFTYHKLCHEIPRLWSVHQMHHTTKHPSPVLGSLAEERQEVLEVFLLPFLTSLVIPFSLPEAYISQFFLAAIEAGGHAGLRQYSKHPLLHPFLAPLGYATSGERHDLHHRYGKSGVDFGKGTAVCDTIFGTKGQLLETYGMDMVN